MKKNLTELFQEFIWESEFVKKSRPATLQGYAQSFDTFLKLAPGASLETINPHFLMQFFKTLQERKRIVGRGGVRVGVKKSTIATYWNRLGAFFHWLRLKGYLKHNPFSTLTYPTPSYEDKKYLNKEDVERILNALYRNPGNPLLMKRDLVMMHLLLFCGLRKEELMHLQLRDIDFERRMLTVRAETSKSGRTRQVPLHSSVLLHLRDYLKERIKYMTPYLIISAGRDDKLSYEGVKHLVNKWREKSGVRFHLHQFRHTFAVNFLKSSNNIVKLKQLLGHKDIRMTMIYLRCLPVDQMREDVEGMSIGQFI
jgi:integrase/recombinase XerD